MQRSRSALPLAASLILLSGAALAAAPSAARPAAAPAPPAVAPAAPAALDGLFAPGPESLPKTPAEPPAWQPRDACFIVGFCQTCADPSKARPCTRTSCNGQTTTRCGTCTTSCVPPPS